VFNFVPFETLALVNSVSGTDKRITDMNTQNEITAVTALIRGYADTLNSGNASAIGGYYATDGAILPNGYKTIKKEQLDQVSGEFLRRSNFKIDFQTERISIDGDYAFVDSVATANSTAADGKLLTKTTRDLFILRKKAAAWKIYRYIFNDIK
jgi:ketosteroid isomerase-like protein